MRNFHPLATSSGWKCKDSRVWRLSPQWKNSNIHNGRRPITYVFKWSRKSTWTYNYDDLKLKKNPLFSIIYTNIFQRWKGWFIRHFFQSITQINYMTHSISHFPYPLRHYVTKCTEKRIGFSPINKLGITIFIAYNNPSISGVGPGTVVKAACLESQRLRARTPLWNSSFKETKCFSPLIRKDSVLWGASVTER